MTTIGNVCAFTNGKAHEQNVVEYGEYIIVNSKFISSDGVVKKYSNKQICPLFKNDIVMVMSDVPNGKAMSKCFCIDKDNKYTLNQRICALRTKQIPLYYMMQINRNDYFMKFDDGVKQTNLRKDDVLACPVYSTTIKEQTKIADFLSLIDQRIEKQRRLVESLKKYKRGYFQRIISSLETSSFELKNIVDEYNAKSKIQNEFPILSSTLSGIKLQNDYFNKQAASETTIGYKIVPFGYFTYRSMSDTGEFRFNLQNIIEKGIVSPAYPVFKVKEEYNAEFVEYILNETDNIKSQLLIKKEGGTRYALSFSKFQTLKIDLPIKNAQDKTVSQLRFINKVLTNEERILSNLQKLKNGLLQQMFI